MPDIKRLLNKKGWTGRELGIIEITNMATRFAQQIQGKPVEPLVETNQLQSMINSITDSTQGRIYNGYIAIHEWLSLHYNIASTQIKTVELELNMLSHFITDATIAENVYQYIESLPVIMTEKQYTEAVQRGRELWLNEEDGTPRTDSILPLIYRAIEYYIKLLAEDPKKPNPLKPIRSKYLSAPVQSKLILSRYNEATQSGYYTLEDGRRSDEMTGEEWQAALTTPKMKETLSEMRTEQTSIAEDLAGERFINRAKLIYSGKTAYEADKEQERRDYEAGLAVPAQWHFYTEPPEDLNKWDLLADACTLYNIYGVALGGYNGEAGEYIDEARDFVAEFKDAVDAVIKDIDKRCYSGEKGLTELPIEEWQATVYPWTQLYEKDLYGFRADTDRADIIWDGNYRALCNGVAILKPSTAILSKNKTDENGDYTPPEIWRKCSRDSLQRFFTEAEDYAEDIATVENSRAALLDGYYYLRGYNLAIDLIAKRFDIPSISVFKVNVRQLEEKIDAINVLVPVLYTLIEQTQYEDKELKQKKLQVLKDVFPEIEYKSLTIPEGNIEKVQELFKEFEAFKDSNIDELLCYRPEDGEGASADED